MGLEAGNWNGMVLTLSGEPTVPIGVAPTAKQMAMAFRPHPPAAECIRTQLPFCTSPNSSSEKCTCKLLGLQDCARCSFWFDTCVCIYFQKNLQKKCVHICIYLQKN